MQMHDVGVVQEAYGMRDANQLLGKGWTLLAVVAVNNDQPTTGLVTCYILGKPAQPASQIPSGGFQQAVQTEVRG
jgi:hypothetical protein